ncbi:phospholipase D-like domain-containing protein [Hymenobacter rubripertinctus]|uniref:phospholipase D n=1 Tax=Hymenobacter rubripertinctus TaxID=2029981 RepID=A0A418R9G5_9BACT|nr:phospholipase D-like domain-containing protein [Hymenobacter rubripertinctus]RIY13902.1 hypothetical protein D0T11_02135 [Hymenobacter rubripertinctus]
MKTYFEGIKEVLVQEIESAEFIIYIAVAWITDYDLISTLVKKMKSGIQIEVIVNGDYQFSKVKSQFNEFLFHGGKLYLYENKGKSIMHNKFCVIDLNTTITGSYNWSFSASAYHKENIIIEKDNFLFASQFAREFFKIKRASIVFDSKYIPYDSAVYASVIKTGDFDEEGFDQYCWVEVEEGNRIGILFVYGCYSYDIPDKIFGVWTEHALDTTYSKENPKLAYHNGKALYDFDCLDSRLSSYRVK